MLDKIPIVRITEKTMRNDKDAVVVEFNLCIVLNNQELVTLICSPEKLEFLAAGYLCSEGLIASKHDIINITLDTTRRVIEVATRKSGKFTKDTTPRLTIASSGGKGVWLRNADHAERKINSQIEISPREVFTLMDDFIGRSDVYKATGGVHSAALCTTKKIILFSEDIGRHNAIDKVFGECLLMDIPMDNRLLVTSGRVSSEIVLKVAKRNIPILISKSAPTHRGITLAEDLGITLIGFVRGKKMNLYSHTRRMANENS